jgi:integral membrane protein
VLGTAIGRLRILGMLEGASFLILLGIAMPLKYIAGRPEMVQVVGMAHGMLFLLFVAAVIRVAVAMRWPLARVAVALAASVVPFGPFVLDARVLRGLESQANVAAA